MHHQLATSSYTHFSTLLHHRHSTAIEAACCAAQHAEQNCDTNRTSPFTGTGVATPPPVATGSPTAEAGHPPTPPANQLEAAALPAAALEPHQEAAPPTFVLLATQHYLRMYTPEGIRQGEAVQEELTPQSEGASLAEMVLWQESHSVETESMALCAPCFLAAFSTVAWRKHQHIFHPLPHGQVCLQPLYAR